MPRTFRPTAAPGLPIQLAALLWAATHWTPVQAGAIAAWYTGLGAPQVITQDDATGNIFYSYCNSNSTPILPLDGSMVLSFSDGLEPKNGTALGGTGYNDGLKNYASIDYLDSNDNIVHTIWACNSEGKLDPYGSTVVISTDAPSVHPNTGLNIQVLGETAGYRVYYQDADNATASLTYDPQANNWDYGGIISHDPIYNMQVAAGFAQNDQISVVVPRDDANIEIIAEQSVSSWDLSTIPRPLNSNITKSEDNTTEILSLTNATSADDIALNSSFPVTWTLEAWDGNAGGIGISFDPDVTRNIFYIGNDSALHHLKEVQSNSTSSSSPTSSSKPDSSSTTSIASATVTSGSLDSLPTFSTSISLNKKRAKDETSSSSSSAPSSSSPTASPSSSAASEPTKTWTSVPAPTANSSSGANPWPLAAQPNAPFALAYNPSVGDIWIYYFTNATLSNTTTNSSTTAKRDDATISLAQIHRTSSNTWDQPVPVPAVNTSAATSSPSSTSSSGSGDGGLSQAAKIGIGVGVGVGGFLILALLAAFFYLRHRKSRAAAAEAARIRSEEETAAAAAAAVERDREERAREERERAAEAEEREKRIQAAVEVETRRRLGNAYGGGGGGQVSPELPAYSGRDTAQEMTEHQQAPVELPARQAVHEVEAYEPAVEMSDHEGAKGGGGEKS